MALPAERVRFALREAQARNGTFLVAAAIGTGMAAQAAARGGADFLVALNAGHLRSMGEPSVAAMLALRDTNRFVMDFAKAEIRPRTTLPVFVGLAACDPRLDLDALLQQVRDAGFEGVTNFPTVALIDGRFRRFLEASGFGMAREIRLLQRARQHGLATLGYVHTGPEARQMAMAGIDIVNIDLGWNTGGALGVATRMPITEAADVAERMIRTVRKVAPDTICVVEGGPIVRPEQMDEVCRAARADGYIGGSTIDRVPLETAIELVTSAFKTMGALRRRVTRLERRLDPRRTPVCLIGDAPPVIAARAAYEQALATDLPILIVGESGTGRRDLARALHGGSRRRARRLTWLTCSAEQDRTEADLFGAEANAAPGIARRRIGWLELARGSTLVLDDLGELELTTQRLLCAAVESGGFRRVGGTDSLPLDVRLVGVSRFDPVRDAGRFDPRLLDLLGAVRIELVPLRDHLEDLSLIIQHLLDALTVGKLPAELDPAAYRVLLGHDWPGNTRELGNVLQQALLTAGGSTILGPHLPHLPPQPPRNARIGFASEREWILDGLRRNRFRRAETARFLGVSRKTLYNKMVALGLMVSVTGGLAR
jgi:predicted TIM-barrel enzyme/DNA-binding NtrC family response regulator